MFVEAYGVATGTITLIESKVTRDYVARIWKRLFEGNRSIIIFGAGGTGKSTLGRFLQDGASPKETGFNESVAVEPLKLPGSIPGCILVAPGQQDRQHHDRPELFRRLSQGVTLLINVVSFGYHTANHNYDEYTFYKSDMSETSFRRACLKSNQDQEFKTLQYLRPHLEAAQAPLKMITLVTKQDLWWSARDEVKNHYQSGPYQEEIQKVFTVKGTEHFSHNYLSMAFKHENLTSKDGKMLFPVAEGYDDLLKQSNANEVVRKVYKLLG